MVLFACSEGFALSQTNKFKVFTSRREQMRNALFDRNLISIFINASTELRPILVHNLHVSAAITFSSSFSALQFHCVFDFPVAMVSQLPVTPQSDGSSEVGAV